jgi:membrane dipeptidase
MVGMAFFDLHCDTLYEALQHRCSLDENTLQLSLRRGITLHPWCQCFAVWIPDTLHGGEAFQLFERAQRKLQEQVERFPGCIQLCRSSGDLKRAQNARKCAAIFTVEGGAVLGGKLDNIQRLQKAGVRMLTLTWNGSCEIGDGAMVKNGGGLTQFGRLALSELERQKIVVDISHACDRLFDDVLERATRPLVASHSNARSVCDHPRNLTDEQFLAIRRSNGLVGLNFHAPFLKKDGEACIEDLLRHAEHFLSLGGENILGIGSDFDGSKMPQGITGIESIANLYECFLRHYPEKTVRSIFFENAYRFFQRALTEM